MQQQTSKVLAYLSAISQIHDLSEAVRKQLAEQSQLIELAPRKRVRAGDIGAVRLFLVDGHVARILNGLGERVESFKGLSEPVDLFAGRSGPDDCFVTESTALLLKVPASALDTALSTSIEVSDIELDPAEGEFVAELYQLVNDKRLELPARPEVALKVQALTNDPESGIQELTEVIQRDGTIAGAILHATNSPLFRGAKEIQTVRDAVVRLGFRNTRMLATNLALRQAFKAKHAATAEAMQAVWNDSVLCSAHSYILADVLGVLNRERALLAGLVAGIGAVPIIQFVERRSPNPRPALIEALVSKLSGITGVLVINYWGLGAEMLAVSERYGCWDYKASEPDYASITLVARWASLQSEGRPYPEAASVPAFRVLGLQIPEPGEPIAELANSASVLESLKSMFLA